MLHAMLKNIRKYVTIPFKLNLFSFNLLAKNDNTCAVKEMSASLSKVPCS